MPKNSLTELLSIPLWHKEISKMICWLLSRTYQFPKTEQYKCSHPVPAPCARLSSHSWRSSWTWAGEPLLGAPGRPSAGAFWQKWGRCQGGLAMSWCPGTCADLLYTGDMRDGEMITEERAEHRNKLLIVERVILTDEKRTDPGLGSGTFPVYSLHFESCTSMYGPSNTFCTSEKVYWQIADALIFFLKNSPPPKRHIQGTHSGLMIHSGVIIWGATDTQLKFQTHHRS